MSIDSRQSADCAHDSISVNVYRVRLLDDLFERTANIAAPLVYQVEDVSMALNGIDTDRELFRIRLGLAQFTNARSISSRCSCEQMVHRYSWRPLLTAFRSAVRLRVTGDLPREVSCLEYCETAERQTPADLVYWNGMEQLEGLRLS